MILFLYIFFLFFVFSFFFYYIVIIRDSEFLQFKQNTQQILFELNHLFDFCDDLKYIEQLQFKQILN